MAEALGVAASGIAIAQVTSQVGKSVIKLKQLLDEIRDVPDDIDDLMQQIDCLDPAIFEAETNFNDTGLPSILWNDTAAKRSTAYCRSALKALTELVDELSLHIQHSRNLRRKVGAVKVLLKKDMLKKLEKRLESAVRMLTLAQQSYLVALTRVQPDIIIQKFTMLTTQPQLGRIDSSVQHPISYSPPEDDHQPRRPNQTVKTPVTQSRGRRQPLFISSYFSGLFSISSCSNGEFYRVAVNSPTWLFRNAWDLQCAKVNSGWQFNLRTYNIRPNDSQVFKAIRDGSLEQFQNMFDSGLASPFDCDEDGLTLLHLSYRHNRSDIFSYLLQSGLDLQASSLGNLTAIEYMTRFIAFLDRYLGSTSSLFTNLVIDYIAESAQTSLVEHARDTNLECTCQLVFHSLEWYVRAQPAQCPSHRSTTLASRIRSACKQRCFPAVFKAILEPEWTTDMVGLLREFKAIRGFGIVEYFVYTAPKNYALLIRMGRELASGWFALATEVMTLMRDNSKTQQATIYIMLQIFSKKYIEPIPWRNHALHLLRMWISSLKHAGADLLKYGRRENQLLLQHDLDSRDSMRCLWFREIKNGRRAHRAWLLRIPVYILGYKYGPEPEDWDIYWNEPSDAYAGDFWNLIENPPLRIPGSWEDAFDEDWSD